MHKITVNKKEDIASLIEKILHVSDSEISLIIPRESQVAEVEANFRLLVREAETAGKHITIESIDDRVLAYAKKYGLAAEHPLFQSKGDHALSDIVQIGEEGKAVGRKIKVNAHTKERETHHTAVEHHQGHAQHEEVSDVEPVEEEEEQNIHPVQMEYSRSAFDRGGQMDEEIDGHRSGRRRMVLVGGVVGLLLAVVIGYGWWFGKVTVSLAFVKNPWEGTYTLTAQKNREVADSNQKLIPAILFTEDKNLVQSFKANGRERVARKAKAKVTLYNAFDGKPQILVATTRLQTPDGKIFRLDNQVTVPAAKIENGKISPSSIEATASADQAGESYNMGPVAKLTIPGFKGTPRFDGFYASMDTASGGMIGEAAVPTQEDVKNAEAKTREALLASVGDSLSRRLPEEYKLLEEATKTEVTKLTVQPETDANGNFSVYGEVRQSAVVFREKDVQYVLNAIAQQSSTEKTLQEVTLTYADITPNFSDGTLSFEVQGKGVLMSPFSKTDLQSKLAGKGLDNLKQELANVAGISEAKFFIYPPWIWSVPSNPDRIEVEVN